MKILKTEKNIKNHGESKAIVELYHDDLVTLSNLFHYARKANEEDLSDKRYTNFYVTLMLLYSVVICCDDLQKKRLKNAISDSFGQSEETERGNKKDEEESD